MPYIDTDSREELALGRPAQTAGELNYLITLLINRYLSSSGTNYQAFNDIVGALEGAKLELYRRFIGPYEDKKISQNGDIQQVHTKPGNH